MCYFNPHEREARDATPAEAQEALKILIHTSVKLVTSNPAEAARAWAILIHTSVKLVTIRYVHPRITHPF